MAARHVAIVHAGYLDLMLEGLKTAEARLTRHRVLPWGAVGPGDEVYFKQASGPFRAVGVVGEVWSYEALDAAALAGLRRRHGAELCADASFWRLKRAARYATIVRLACVRAWSGVPEGFHRTPGSRAAWFVLDDQSDQRSTSLPNCSPASRIA